MAINRNITMPALGAGRRVENGEEGAPAPKTARSSGAIGSFESVGSMGTAFFNPAFLTAPGVSAAPQPPPGVAAPAAAQPIAEAPTMLTLNPGLLANLGIFRPPVNKTTTQIAQGAMAQLRGAQPGVLREAMSNIRNKNIAAGELVNFLERRTRVGEVLNELANDWSAPTKQDFAEAFQMTNTADKLPVMDAIVSIAVLNDPDLRNELQAENTTEASQADLLENRRIVWQWPQPGTPFTPPYLIVVAVERQDTAQAQNIVQSIIGDLVDFQGFKIPTAAANRLR